MHNILNTITNALMNRGDNQPSPQTNKNAQGARNIIQAMHFLPGTPIDGALIPKLNITDNTPTVQEPDYSIRSPQMQDLINRNPNAQYRAHPAFTIPNARPDNTNQGYNI